jgi:hypothetical protein
MMGAVYLASVGHYSSTSVTFEMTTPPHLMRQPRSRRAQQRRRRVVLAVLLGVIFASGGYLLR